jgi:hypothetical protein
MQPVITDCRALPNAPLWVRFTDGAEATIDLSDLLGQGVFAAWSDPAFFAKVAVDPETGTVVWPGGIDLDPYVLYSQATGKPLPGQGSVRAAS